jgi:hypothetical protein
VPVLASILLPHCPPPPSPHLMCVQVGLGGCSQWKLCGLDADTTVCIMFEITGTGSSVQEQGQVCVCVWVGIYWCCRLC